MLSLLDDEIVDLVRSSIDKKTLIITIGNTFRSDDGVGPFIAENLDGLLDNFTLINAFDKPENIIDEAIEASPERTLIIDAANFGGLPGEIRIIPGEYIPNSTLTTHTFPIKIIAKMLEEDTGCELFFIGIQPKLLELGEGLSSEVVQTAEEIIKILKNL